MSYPALTLGATPATLIVSGPWTTAQSASLERLVATSPSIDAQRRNFVIDISGVEHLDTMGAWLLERLMRGYQLQELKPTFVGVPERFRGLLEKIHDVNRRSPIQHLEKNRLTAALEGVGHGHDVLVEEGLHLVGGHLFRP